MDDFGLNDRGILCLWRLSDPGAPYRILVCESEPSCCCFAPIKPNLVFAGTDCGSVLAWDLQESPTTHEKIHVGGEETTFRYPSYSTDGIYTLQGAHEEPIRCVIALPHAQENKGTSELFTFGSFGRDQGSFQLASIDTAGAVQLWVRSCHHQFSCVRKVACTALSVISFQAVIELLDESFATAEPDYGMRIGSRIKLVRSTALKLSSPDR